MKMAESFPLTVYPFTAGKAIYQKQNKLIGTEIFWCHITIYSLFMEIL